MLWLNQKTEWRHRRHEQDHRSDIARLAWTPAAGMDAAAGVATEGQSSVLFLNRYLFWLLVW